MVPGSLNDRVVSPEASRVGGVWTTSTTKASITSSVSGCQSLMVTLSTKYSELPSICCGAYQKV